MFNAGHGCSACAGLEDAAVVPGVMVHLVACVGQLRFHFDRQPRRRAVADNDSAIIPTVFEDLGSLNQLVLSPVKPRAGGTMAPRPAHARTHALLYPVMSMNLHCTGSLAVS